MGDIDDKLKAIKILRKVSPGEPAEFELRAEEIAQIKQAFKEEGYENTNAQFVAKFSQELKDMGKVDMFDMAWYSEAMRSAKRAAGIND